MKNELVEERIRKSTDILKKIIMVIALMKNAYRYEWVHEVYLHTHTHTHSVICFCRLETPFCRVRSLLREGVWQEIPALTQLSHTHSFL